MVIAHCSFQPIKPEMYEGFSKNNGSVIGDTALGCHNVDISEAQESTAAEESLICMNEKGEELVLNAKISPESGNISWCELYDRETIMKRTVGMSQMTSMLRDNDRNNTYEMAIRILINSFVEEHGRPPVVLDIGAGTGLLSMLSVRHGADFVFAVEMFDTMAGIAEKVICDNDGSDTIIVINAKSSDIEELPTSPDILVSELLDSALLGEGCMPAHKDAISRLLKKCVDNDDAGIDVDRNNSFANRVLPYSGSIHATLIESIEVKHMHDVQSINLAGPLRSDTTDDEFEDADTIHNSCHFFPHRSAHASVCKGGRNLVPVHWDQLLHREGNRELSNSEVVLHPNFTSFPSNHPARPAECDDSSGLYNNSTSSVGFNGNIADCSRHSVDECWYWTDITVTAGGTIHGILLWWTLFLLSPKLDPKRSCCYSTQPGVQNWQDHWQQTVFPLPVEISVSVSDVVRVFARHDSVQVRVHAVKLPPTEAVNSKISCDRSQDSRIASQPDLKRARVDQTQVSCNTAPASATGRNNMVLCHPSAEDAFTSLQVHSELSEELSEVTSSLCTCGWHMLCGAERYQGMCDPVRATAWQGALDKLVTLLCSEQPIDTTQSAPPTDSLILDVSDGSLLALSLALKLKKLRGDCSNIGVVSKETKAFSALFFGQVTEANGLEDALMVWDGLDTSDIADFFCTSKNKEEVVHGDDEERDDEDELIPLDVNESVVAVVCECYYFQLHALPTWQALSFYYQLQALQRQGLLREGCKVLPGRALIRAAVVEIPHLSRCHGLANK